MLNMWNLWIIWNNQKTKNISRVQIHTEIRLVAKKTCYKLTFKSTNYVHYKFINEHSLKNLCTIKQNCIRTKNVNNVKRVKWQWSNWNQNGIKYRYLLIPFIILKIMWRPSVFSKSSQTLNTSTSFRKKSCCIQNIYERKHRVKKKLTKDSKALCHTDEECN
jgi:hypothetical protein